MVSLSRDTPSWAMMDDSSWTRSQPNFPPWKIFIRHLSFLSFLLDRTRSPSCILDEVNSLVSRVRGNILTIVIVRSFWSTPFSRRRLEEGVGGDALVVLSGLEKWRKGAPGREWVTGGINWTKKVCAGERKRERESHVLVNLSQLFKRSW